MGTARGGFRGHTGDVDAQRGDRSRFYYNFYINEIGAILSKNSFHTISIPLKNILKPPLGTGAWDFF